MNYFAVNLKSVAHFELKKGNTELGRIMIEAADKIERLQEKVEILEAEIRVMRKLPAAVNAAVDAVIAADGQSARDDG